MKEKLSAFFLSSLVITLLLIVSPAQAFFLNLESDQTSITQGELINFTAEIEISSQEILPINSLTLELSGPENITCTFSPDGNPASPCESITITKISDTPFGFGYGYGYYFGYGYNFNYGYGYSPSFGYGYSIDSKLAYQMTLDTSSHLPGKYQTRLSAKINSQEFSESGEEITINLLPIPQTPQEEQEQGGSCRTSWQCSEWSQCINGVQTRTCEKVISYCRADSIEETRFCALQDFEPLEQENSEQDQISSNSPITGAVIGAGNAIKSTTGIITIIVLLIASLGVSVIRFRRRKLVRKIFTQERSNKFYF